MVPFDHKKLIRALLKLRELPREDLEGMLVQVAETEPETLIRLIEMWNVPAWQRTLPAFRV